MADYTSSTDVRALVTDSNLTTDSSYDTVIGTLITAASRMIDHYCGGWDNYFYPTTDNVVRYYDGSGETAQEIDDMVTLSSVAVAENGSTDYTTWTLDTDFIVYPYNYSQIARPISELHIDRNASKSWTRFRKAVKVTGVFGFSATPPADVVQACKIQALRWFMRGKQTYQDAAASVATGEIIYTQELDPDIKMLLHHYRVVNA